MKKKAFRAALPYTLPICVAFLFLGMSYGFLMRSKGFSFVYPMCMSLFIYAGSMEFVTVEDVYKRQPHVRPARSDRGNLHSVNCSIRRIGILTGTWEKILTGQAVPRILSI